MKALVNFLRTSAIFFVGSILSKIIIFIMLPIYTKYLLTDEYGYFDVSNTYITIITWVVFLELSPAIVKFLLKNENDEFRNEVISSCALIFIVSFVIYFFVGVILHSVMNILYLWYIFFYGLTNVVRGEFETYTRGYGDNVSYAVGGLINTTITTVLNLVMIVYFQIGVVSLYIAPCIGNILQIVFLNGRHNFVRYLIRLPKNFKIAKDIVMFGVPTTLNLVMYWFLIGYGVTEVSRCLDLSQNGVYAVGTKFGSVVNLVTMCFLFAWQEISYRRKKKNDTLFYTCACEGYLLFLSLGVFFLLPLCRFLFPYLVDDSYSEAISIIPTAVIVAVVGAYENFLANVFYAEIKAKYVVFPLVIGALLNIALMPFMIELFGLQGVNYTIFTAFIVCIVLMHIMARIYLKIKCNYSLLFFVISELVLFCVIFLLSSNLMMLIVTTTMFVFNSCILFFRYKKYLIE